MPIHLECPICEAVLQVDDGQADESTVCPECNREFEIANSIIVSSEFSEDDLIRQPPAREPIPSQVPVLKRDPDESVEYRLAKDPEVINEGQPSKFHLRQRRHLRGQNRPWLSMPITLVVLALIAIGLLVFLPFALKFSNSLTEADQVANQSDDLENGLNPSIQPASDVNAGGRGNVQPANRTRQNQPPRKPEPDTTSFSVFNAGQAADIWRDAQPRIVKLEIEKATGTTTAVGTIVDSRGWLVTSYRAVAGALNIKLTQTAPSYNYEHTDTLLTDLARGVIAVDPESDLALLAINRRFVVTVSAINLADDDRLVAAKRLLQASYPMDTTRLGIREVRIKNRRRFAELTPDEKTVFVANGLEENPIDWVQLTDGVVVPGAPLLDGKGRFVAFCTNLAENEHLYAIPATLVNKLIESTDGTVRDIADIQTASPNLGANSVAADMGVAADHPNRTESVNLNAAGVTCQLFKFQPKTDEQYRDLQELVRQIAIADETLAKNEKSGPAAELKKQVETWKSALAPQTEILAPDFNQLAIQGLETDPTAFPAYVQVHYSAMASPRFENRDTITYKLIGTDRLIVSYFEDDIPVMRPDSKWYVVFGADEVVQLGIDDGGVKTKRANFARILWVNGELVD